MGRRIDQICEVLRIKLTNVESNLAALRAKVEARPQASEKEMIRHLEGVRHRIKLDRTKLLAARAEVEEWAGTRTMATTDMIAAWIVARETSKLQDWSDQAERHAEASIEIALSAIDEAEQAAVEAWLARNDVISVIAARRRFW
ncbi:MAG: hypothetical protein D4S02_18575 [Rhodocyclaceae bacterium]|nr:MAG: hypothetical protein D4S02_18575 [Rhodocyclaceae bacterium]